MGYGMRTNSFDSDKWVIVCELVRLTRDAHSNLEQSIFYKFV